MIWMKCAVGVLVFLLPCVAYGIELHPSKYRDAYYGSVRLGRSILNSEDHNAQEWFAEEQSTVGVGLALGTTMNQIRTELELFYMHINADIEAKKLGPNKVSALMHEYFVNINGYYDFNLEGKLQPYVGGGLGFLYVDSSVGGLQVKDERTITYQVLLGLNYIVSKEISIGCGYRLLNAFENKAVDGLSDHATLRLNYHF